MNNLKIIPIILITALAGLGAGYLIFGRQAAETHSHETTSVETTAGEEIWTCSMHPQIRQNEPGDCPICGMDLIPLGSGGGADNPLVMEMTREAVKLANIQTTAVGAAGRENAKRISLTGKVQADERLASSQAAHIPGRIEQLFVTFTGEAIVKGQKLAVIYSPELVAAQRELIEAAKWRETRPQLLEAARTKLRYWKIPEDTIEQIEQSGEIQSTITILADQSGIVLKRRVAVGDYVKEGGVLFDVASLSRVWILFDAYEEDLPDIRLGDQVEYTVAALPGRTFKARISFIDPVINPQTRVASLRAEVANPGGRLKPEMLVRGTILTDAPAPKGALSVPKTAVMWTGPRSVVYVEAPGASVPSYEFREVTLGDAVGDRYLVLSGLEAGERVVTNGAFVIDAAAQLNNMASMMNRNVRRAGAEAEVPDYSGETPEAFRLQLMNVVDRYLPLKDALVATDASQAAAAADQLTAALDQVDMSLLAGEAHNYWMQQQTALKAHGDQLQESASIEEQRKQFSFFTNALVETLTAFGTSGDSLYLQHCPMAFNNEGADWLSAEEAILNPYFGDEMLTCGVVKSVLPISK
jgi:Cu(I)/Ag(I) efflux system membrane fusion protein